MNNRILASIHLLPIAGKVYAPSEAGRYQNYLTKEVGRTYTNWDYTKWMDGREVIGAHHIYLTTEEEIKEPCWVIHTKHNSLMQLGDEAKLMKDHIYLRKILATDNPELWQLIHGPIRKVPQDLIEAIVASQGKLKSVWLETEYSAYEDKNLVGFKEDSNGFIIGYKLKLSPAGCIIWKPVRIDNHPQG